MTGATRRELLGAALGAAAVAAGRHAGAIEPLHRSSTGARLRLGLCAFSYRQFLYGKLEAKMSLPQFIDRAAALNVDGVEITEYFVPKPVPAGYMQALKRQCFLLGLHVSGSAMRNELTLPPGPKRDAEIATCKAWVDRVAELGAPCLRVFVGGLQKGGQTLEEARRLAVQALEDCCAYAGSKGVVLALENHGGIVADSEGVLDIVKAVRSDWFGVNLDVGNFHTEDPYADIARCAPYAVTVHLKDAVTPRGVASREIDYRRVAGILRDAGYRGYINLEYEGSGAPLEVVPRVLEKMRAAIG